MKAEPNPPKPEDNISEALEAVQRMVLQMESDEGVATIAETQERKECRACGGANPPANRFCARCGVPLQDAPAGEAPAGTIRSPKAEDAAGQHFYHHHYHHHYFAPGETQPGVTATSVSAPAAARGRAPAGTAGPSRAETAVRRLSQDWAQACNTKHLDDLVELYAADAMVVRPNVPAVRTAAAIREFFFTAMEAGLGEVEMEPLRVEVMGEFAYEIGRCTMLVPGAAGKRREERGKYVLVSARQAGEWKVIVDTWSADLALSEMAAPKPAKSA